MPSAHRLSELNILAKFYENPAYPIITRKWHRQAGISDYLTRCQPSVFPSNPGHIWGAFSDRFLNLQM